MSLHVLVTGASSGIGAAVSALLGQAGHRLSLGARRTERIDELLRQTDLAPELCHRGKLDVTDEESVERFLAGATSAHGPIDVLINNAGLARGVEKIADADGIAWREMIETNVMGVLHVTRRVLPGMIARGSGQIVMVGSIAGREPYEGGSVYCGSKAALASITRVLRYETLGTGVRVSTIDPGMVDTEFSAVRFRGDTEKAAAVYSGVQPLSARDVAECVAFVVSRPAHVNIDSMLVMPTAQASAKRVHRTTDA